MIDLTALPIRDVVAGSRLRHIAFIMDGNGRWATVKGQPREMGHRAGASNFKTIVRYCKSIGIGCCTVYAFSTENFRRPAREVNAIMSLLIDYIAEAGDERDIEFRFIGDPDALGDSIGRKCHALEKETAGRPYRLNIALNYGGRAEILQAVNRLILEHKRVITEEDINTHLYTAGCPEPDLIVRTGNEQRISNFLTWQSTYSEFHFSAKMWPDYTTDDVDIAVRDFASRGRRWGGIEDK